MLFIVFLMNRKRNSYLLGWICSHSIAFDFILNSNVAINPSWGNYFLGFRLLGYGGEMR